MNKKQYIELKTEDLYPSEQMLDYQKTIKRWIVWHLYGSGTCDVGFVRSKVRESLKDDYIISDEPFDMLLKDLVKEGYVRRVNDGNRYLLNLMASPCD